MYICNNSNCSAFKQHKNPGGRIIIKNGEVYFTGSMCSKCGMQMDEVKNKIHGNFNINNKTDGRNS